MLCYPLVCCLYCENNRSLYAMTNSIHYPIYFNVFNFTSILLTEVFVSLNFAKELIVNFIQHSYTFSKIQLWIENKQIKKTFFNMFHSVTAFQYDSVMFTQLDQLVKARYSFSLIKKRNTYQMNITFEHIFWHIAFSSTIGVFLDSSREGLSMILTIISWFYLHFNDTVGYWVSCKKCKNESMF